MRCVGPSGLRSLRLPWLSIMFVVVFLPIETQSASVRQAEDEDSLLRLHNEVKAIEAAEGQFDETLVPPLQEMGLTRLRLGELDEARSNLQRAQTIVHRHHGVRAMDQLELVEALVEVEMAAGGVLAANQRMGLVRLLAESNGMDEPGYLALVERLAAWYQRTGQRDDAREFLRRSIALNGTVGEIDQPRLVRQSILLAQLLQTHRTCCAHKVLDSALARLRKSGASDADTGRMLVHLGDAYIVQGMFDEAASAYGEAWTYLTFAERNKLDEPQVISMGASLWRPAVIGVKTKTIIRVPGSGGSSTYNVAGNRAGTLGPDDQEALPEKHEDFGIRSPQYFLVPANPDDNRSKITRRHDAARFRTPLIDLIGDPFRLPAKQLFSVVPRRNFERPGGVRVTINVHVKASGRGVRPRYPGNNAPRAVTRVMSDVLRKARFRPAVVNGEPVDYSDFRFVQVFELEGPDS